MLLRTWAFHEAAGLPTALQPAPGQYNERTLAALDWVVQQCMRRGIRLLLTLTNYQPDYGGLAAYARCVCGVQHESMLHANIA
jgi:hypothetical protein